MRAHWHLSDHHCLYQSSWTSHPPAAFWQPWSHGELHGKQNLWTVCHANPKSLFSADGSHSAGNHHLVKENTENHPIRWRRKHFDDPPQLQSPKDDKIILAKEKMNLFHSKRQPKNICLCASQQQKQRNLFFRGCAQNACAFYHHAPVSSIQIHHTGVSNKPDSSNLFH